MAVIASAAADIPGAIHTTLFGGRARLIAFGKWYPNAESVLERQDWSFRPFRNVSDSTSLPEHSITRYLPKIVNDFVLPKILLSPSPRLFNAKICTSQELSQKRVMVSSRDYHNTVWLEQGADADGMVLGCNDTFLISLAGCPLLLVWDQERNALGVAHAGMRCVIDEGRLKGETPRAHESVVVSLLEAMNIRHKQSAKRLKAIVAFPIDPLYFTYAWHDPTYGVLNKKRTEELVRLWGSDAIFGYDEPIARSMGRPDLAVILRRQLISLGVPPWNIEVVESPPRSVWYDTRESKPDELKRNLVIVQHLSK